MYPKSTDGKPPLFLAALEPGFGARLAEWVHKDMIRAKNAKQAKEAKAKAALEAEAKKSQRPSGGS